MTKIDMQLIALGMRQGLKATLADLEAGKLDSVKIMLNGFDEALESFGQPGEHGSAVDLTPHERATTLAAMKMWQYEIDGGHEIRASLERFATMNGKAELLVDDELDTLVDKFKEKP